MHYYAIDFRFLIVCVRACVHYGWLGGGGGGQWKELCVEVWVFVCKFTSE